MASVASVSLITPGALRPGEDYLELIAELIEQFAASEDLEASLALALGRIAEAMDADAAGLFLLDRAHDDPAARIVCRACTGPIDVKGLDLPAHIGIPGRVLARNHAEVIADTQGDPDFLAPQTIGIDYDIRSLICAPLSHREERYGVIEMINPRQPGALFTARDAEALGALAAAAALAIRNARLTQALLAQGRLQQELELAAAVQRTLLPTAQNDCTPIQGLNIPARGVSGDFYDLLTLPDGRILFALADVSGKGMNAALIMVKAATLFRSFGKRIAEPGRLLARIETELCETLAFGMFVTMIVGLYNPRTREVRLANAGHLPALRRDRCGSWQEYPALAPPLGIVSRAAGKRFEEQAFSLEDSSLYLYTDGATEARLPSGEMLGMDGLRALIGRHAEAAPGRRLREIAAALGDGVSDDLTLLVIEDQGAAARPQPRRRRRTAQLVAQSIPAQVGQLKIVRRLVDAAAREAGAGLDWAQELVLAVDEACQNIIRHGYQGCPDGRIEFSIRRLRDALEVELVDYAPAADPERCKGRALDDLKPGGLGTHFMHALTDLVQFAKPPAGAGNRLLLTKKLVAPLAGGPGDCSDSAQTSTDRGAAGR